MAHQSALAEAHLAQGRDMNRACPQDIKVVAPRESQGLLDMCWTRHM